MNTLLPTAHAEVAATPARNPRHSPRHIIAAKAGVDSAPGKTDYACNVAGVYQDSVTRDWAVQWCEAGTRRLGEDHVQKTWHDVHSLSDPGILLDAVRAAIVADVIVVSVHAANELPLDLYVWIDLWLPRRRSRTGALAALIGLAEPADSQSVRTHQYLQAVARRGRLDYIPQARQRPPASPGFSLTLIAEGV